MGIMSAESAGDRDYDKALSELPEDGLTDVLVWVRMEKLGSNETGPGMAASAKYHLPWLNSQAKKALSAAVQALPEYQSSIFLVLRSPQRRTCQTTYAEESDSIHPEAKGTSFVAGGSLILK